MAYMKTLQARTLSKTLSFRSCAELLQSIQFGRERETVFYAVVYSGECLRRCWIKELDYKEKVRKFMFKLLKTASGQCQHIKVGKD
jgi:hypothetical protein